MSAYRWSDVFQKYSQKVKAFLFSKDVLTFLLFLLLSTAFWFVHALDRSRETQINVPLVLTGVPADVVLQGELPQFVSVKIKDEGKNLLAYSKKNIVPLTLDCSSVFQNNTAVSGAVCFGKEELKQGLAGSLNATTNLLAVTPELLDVHYVRQQQKTVPVRLEVHLYPARQYMIRKSIVNPAEITIYGLASDLETVNEVVTEALTLSEIKDSVKTDVPLVSRDGVRYNVSSVRLSVVAEQFTEKRFVLPVEPQNFPDNVDVRVFPADVSVTCNVPLSEFATVDAEDIRVVLDYKDINIDDDVQQKLQVQCDLPYVKQLRVVPAEVEFILEMKE